jgi:hypothetical protein
MKVCSLPLMLLLAAFCFASTVLPAAGQTADGGSDGGWKVSAKNITR